MISRKIAVLTSLVLGILLLTSQAFAATPTPISGSISPPTSLGDVIGVVDGFTVFHHHDSHTLSGSLSGTTSEDATIMINFSTGQGTFHGFLFFTGTANGSTGTLTLELNGVFNLPGVQGNWVIVNSGGGLSGTLGQGTWGFTNIATAGFYVGQAQFGTA